MNRRLLLTPLFWFVFIFSALAQAPVAKIIATPVAGCAPLVVGFNDASSGSPTSWSWNFGGVPPAVSPGTATNPNAVVIYTTPGTYFVTLTVSNASGSNTSAPFQITVFPSPTADFDVDKLTGCFPTTVKFTDKSTPGPGGATLVSWTWSYGDGNVDPNTQNPSHTYTTGGSFPVTLYVKNNYGCQGKTNVKTGAIVLSNGVIPNYNTAIANSCQVPISANFTNGTTGPGTLTYTWDFGDGSGFSNQPSPSHTFNAAGNYNVKLTAVSDQGCSDTVSTVVKIATSSNVSSFNAAASVCINSPVTFNNTSNPFPNSSSWDYGDGSPIDNVRNGLHTYTTAGPFTVTLNNAFSNCNGSVSQAIQVVNPPTAAFTGTSIAGCVPPMTATFTDQSTGATSWLWDFGDGSAKSTLQNPTHTYTTYGSFTVTLTASSAGGCSNSVTKTAYVNVIKPIVSIPSLPAFGCAPYTFTPSISVTQAEGIASYHWDFGNGNTFDGQTPPPQIYGAGVFQVNLTITTNGGCTASVTGTVKVGTIQPVPDFVATPTTACVNTPIQFTDQSTGGANQWLWDFGDGSSSPLQNPAHTYLKPGTFTVKLTAYNDGCTQPTPKTMNITINSPLADFDYTFDCMASNNFNFKDQSTGPLTWLWDFADGSTSTMQNPAHLYAPGAPTTYNVILKVTNGTCTSSISKPVIANQVTSITAATNPICKNNTAIITTTHPNNIVSYLFDFGDGSTANSSSGATSHQYTVAKDYNITVTTTDNTGCKATSLPYIMHVTGPTAKFSAPVQQGCNNFAASFMDLSAFTAGVPITAWAWDFGDGGVSNQQNPVHNYTIEGVFPVKLKVTDANGCTDSVTVPGYITFSSPKPSFTTTGTDFGICSNIKFTNTSQSIFSPVYTWDFKDGTTFVGKDPPLHNFPTVGQYPVTLSVTDAQGCSNTFVMPVPINIDIPVASFTMSSNYSSCPPLVDQFTFTGHYAQSYSWTFGDGSTSNLQNPANTFAKPGDYDVNLIVVSPGGCITSAPPQHIHIDGPVGVLLYSPTSACDSLDVNFEVKTGNTVQFTWFFGDNSLPVTGTVPTITHHYNTPGQYLPFVTLKDASGCPVNYSGNDSIYIDRIINTSFTIDKTTLCNNGDGKITFTDNSSLAKGTVINNYLWDFGDGTTQSGMLPTISHIFTTVQKYNVTLTITTVYGCADTKTLPVEVVAAPQISIGGLTPQCEPATLNFTGNETVADPNGPLIWAWDFGNGQTSAAQNPPAVLYPKAGTYTVTLTATNSLGCTSTIPSPANPLIIYPIPKVDAGSDMTVCLNGPDFQLNATGDPGNTYTWQTPVNGTLSCYPCANPMANSTVSTYFVVNGQSPFGCSANDTVKIKVNAKETVTVSGADSVCLGQSAQLQASGADLYTWTPATGLSNPSIANPVATPDGTQIGVTSYQVTGTDDIKCFSDTKTIQVTTFNYPTIELGPGVTIPVGTSYQINGTGSSDIVTLNWIPATDLSCTNCLNPTASPIKTTDYVLHVVNDGGCAASDSIRIMVICDGKNFFIPNTFSPNGDGSNDRFIVRGVGLNVIPSITIFNRWGQVVFEKRNFAPNDEASGWDGNFNGKPAPSDVYIYTIQILCNNATLIPYHGNVTLIR